MRASHGKHAREKSRRGGADDAYGRKVSRALRWSFGSTALTKLSIFSVNVMLSRLLGPHAFGAFAVALVALLAMQTFNDLGFGMAIVRWEADPAEIIPTVMTTSVLTSALAYVGCFFLAPVYATEMGAPAATDIVRIVGVSLIIDGFINTASAVLQRNLQARQRTIAMQSGWVGTAVTVALALTGHGAMSLAIGQVSGALATGTLCTVFAPSSLRFGFDPEKARKLLDFGLPLAGSNLVAFAAGSADQVIVGHLLGPVELGFFVLAFNLASWPLSMFTRPVRHVLPAVFSRLQGDDTVLRAAFLGAAGLLLAVALPVCALIGGSARALIGFVYGAHWIPAAQPLMWLALLSGARVVIELGYDYLVVLARTRFLLAGQLVWLMALVPALIAGSSDGLYGAALAECIVVTLLVLPVYGFGLRRGGIPGGGLARELCLPVAGGVLTLLAGMEARNVLSGSLPALAVSGSAAVAVMAVLVYSKRATLAMFRGLTPGAPPVVVPAAAGAEPGYGTTSWRAEPADGRWWSPDQQGAAGTEPCRRDASDGQRSAPTTPDILSSTLTGGIPVYRDSLVGPPVWQDLALTSPLYSVTVASRLWDPLNPAGQVSTAREF